MIKGQPTVQAQGQGAQTNVNTQPSKAPPMGHMKIHVDAACRQDRGRSAALCAGTQMEFFWAVLP